MFAAVIFDFDGVILDSEPLHFAAYNQILKNLDIHISYAEYHAKYIGLSDNEMFPLLLKSKGLHFSAQEIAVLFQQKIAAYTDIMRTQNPLPIIPGVAEYIRHLAKQGTKMAICSGSTRPEVMAALESFEQGALLPYFQTIVTYEDVQYGKPSPQGYLLCMQQLNVAPTQCMTIEDTPHGITAAKTAGLYVVGLLTTHNEAKLQEADKIIKNFRELM